MIVAVTYRLASQVAHNAALSVQQEGQDIFDLHFQTAQFLFVTPDQTQYLLEDLILRQ